MSEATIYPTAGALGNEDKRHRKKRRGADGGRLEGTKPEIPSNAPAKDAVPPIFSDAPPTPGFNLVGKPDLLKREQGVRSYEIKYGSLFRRGSLNNESYLHFIVKSNKNEWIRFNRQSISLVVYGQYKNPGYKAPNDPGYAAATEANKREWHAMTAREQKPVLWVDPDVMGSSFFHRIDVSINGVQVPTNGAIGNLFLQCVRANHVYNASTNRKSHFNRSSQYKWTAVDQLSEVMLKATGPFDYNTYSSGTGVLIPVYLDCVFPFDFKCRLLESVDNVKEPNLYLPPDSEVEIKLHTHRTKMEALFHSQLTMSKYFDTSNIDDPESLKFTFQDATLEYESVMLQPSQEMSLMNQFDRGGQGFYNYDIARGQHQALAAKASFTENTFQIMPWCRLVVIMFLPDWATFPMEGKKRPLSGFSRFPANASKITLSMAGEDHLITRYFERFGIAGEQHQITKKIYYEYVKNLRLTNADFDDWFPKSDTDHSLIQSFLYDARSHMSDKNEQLSVRCEFAAGHDSPEHIQVACITIHPNGCAVVSAGPTRYSWVWEFKQGV